MPSSLLEPLDAKRRDDWKCRIWIAQYEDGALLISHTLDTSCSHLSCQHALLANMQCHQTWQKSSRRANSLDSSSHSILDPAYETLSVVARKCNILIRGCSELSDSLTGL